ncbi:YhbY family RNA-binding protein [Orrella daihaiensis]|uniref:YhbY family RNA-binding protein n=1 Tax=Orrella daihaiensis TaxID=2782176 RepID=A0ABY4AI04_9BURK|nr:YhbY family RNA-binding protein [Orrella daihaiensis]UOD49919.1 YhbY family RNA-binding protein [Orrella daihaiensis]
MSESHTPISLTSQARSALRGAAHSLRPVVLIGDQGLTSAVLKEIDLALTAHELIKVRAGSQEREERNEMLSQISEELGCAPIHHLGKTLILYRPGKKGLYSVAAGIAVAKEPRTTRKASEPHTPKKLAAQGKKAGRKTASKTMATPSARESSSGKPSIKAFSAERSGVKAKPKRAASAGKPGSRLRSPAKKSARSALSLRAGARRGAK